MYISHSKEFEKNLAKMSKSVVAELKLRTQLLVENQSNPLLKIHKLHGEYVGYKSLNLSGDIRVLFLQKSDDHIHIVNIGTHSKLYE